MFVYFYFLLFWVFFYVYQSKPELSNLPQPSEYCNYRYVLQYPESLTFLFLFFFEQLLWSNYCAALSERSSCVIGVYQPSHSSERDSDPIITNVEMFLFLIVLFADLVLTSPREVTSHQRYSLEELFWANTCRHMHDQGARKAQMCQQNVNTLIR